MYVHLPSNLILILPPKTGTRAVEKAVRQRGFGSRKGRHGICEKLCEVIKDKGGTIASTVRHPADMMVSWYFYNHRSRPNEKKPTFEEWLPGFLNGGGAFTKVGKRLFYGARWMNEIIKYERGLQEELNRVLRNSNVEEVELERVGKESKGRKDWKTYFNQELLDRLYARFPEDFEDFCYEAKL